MIKKEGKSTPSSLSLEDKVTKHTTENYTIIWDKELGQYSAILTERAWSIKDLLYGFTVNNGARVTGNPERAR